LPKREAIAKGMNCLVIGYGSIGRRHASVLANLDYFVHVISKQDIKEYPCYKTVGEALGRKRFDYVVICNETADHYQSFQELNAHGYTGKILIEKPIFSEMPPAFPDYSDRVFVGYNLRFHPVLQKLYDICRHNDLYSFHVYAGQYLPSWRPGTDYPKSYSASRAKGGGVLNDLSHELDYVLWLVGNWVRVSATGGKFSSLEIDSADIFSLLLETERCPVTSVQLNYLDIPPRRDIIAHLKGMSVKADLIENTLEFNGKETRYDVDRNITYLLQHEAILNGDYAALCPYREGLHALELIKAAETASERRMWIERVNLKKS